MAEGGYAEVAVAPCLRSRTDLNASSSDSKLSILEVRVVMVLGVREAVAVTYCPGRHEDLDHSQRLLLYL